MKHKDVFTLIKKQNLYNVIQDMIVELMDLDYEQTVVMLLEKNTITSETVIEKLKNHEQHLYRVSSIDFLALIKNMRYLERSRN